MQSSIPQLLANYQSGQRTIHDTVEHILTACEANPDPAVWISLASKQDLKKRAKELELRQKQGDIMPLYGIPFAVKDNIDALGFQTTAGCPAYAYHPKQNAPVVQQLLEAGAILVGKTNMDQFATGLVGTRSPYGAARCVYNRAYISGGSSSGSGVAVARHMVCFALGTDTAGSGRVPAAFNGIVGLKPSRGLLSTRGVVPACRSLDCVSIFAADTESAQAVLDVAIGFDEQDPYSRQMQQNKKQPSPSESNQNESSPHTNQTGLTIGVLPQDQRQFFGDGHSADLYEKAIKRFKSLNEVHHVVEIDYAPFAEAADLLYGGPWVAERTHAVGDFIAQNLTACDTAVRSIVLAGRSATAVAAFDAAYKLETLKRQAAHAMQGIDVVLLPTTPTIYTVDEVNAEPVQLNTNLGIYNNFMNLLDMCGLTVPAGFRPNHTPFGVTLASTAFDDNTLLELGTAYQKQFTQDQQQNQKHTTSSTYLQKPALDDWSDAPKTIKLAVVGAHLSGMPLNHQLTSRGGTLVLSTQTAPCYRLYALAGTTPAKPGLVREAKSDAMQSFDSPTQSIEVEVWSLTEQAFGQFTQEVPAPLAIGNIELQDGSWVKGFVCEPAAIVDATHITHHGSWRNYMASQK